MSRIIEYPEKTGYTTQDYLLLDSENIGSRKIRADRVGVRIGSEAGQAADGKVVDRMRSELSRTEDTIESNLVRLIPYDRQLFDVSSMIPVIPIILGVQDSGKIVEATAYRMYVVEINGKEGEQYSYNFVTKSGSTAEDLNQIGLYASNAIPVAEEYVLQTGFANLENKRANITLGQNSKYLLIVIRLSSPSVSLREQYTEACNAVMSYIVVRKGSYEVMVENLDNGNKSDVSGANYWITSLVNDTFAKAIPFGKTYDLSLTSAKAFGGYYYLYSGLTAIINGGGFDHLWRCNMLTQRAWARQTRKWYLYGARLIYKHVS